jgi:AraC-like DNA-binding protein
MKRVEREITPINRAQFYLLQNHYNALFDYPIHYHPEYEINLVFNTFGKRIIGDTIESYKGNDLVLVGSNTLHAWTSESAGNNARVITIQFARDFLDRRTLEFDVLQPLKKLLEESQFGVVFRGKELAVLKHKILLLTKATGFNGFLDFLSLLYDMASSSYELLLSSPIMNKPDEVQNHSRILEACDFIKKNYRKKICIEDVAGLIHMSPSAFSHFFKKRTYRSFTDYLIDMRISNACKLLLETDLSIAHISEVNGFNNVSNFNKLFKMKKNMTPKDFRKIRLQKWNETHGRDNRGL